MLHSEEKLCVVCFLILTHRDPSNFHVRLASFLTPRDLLLCQWLRQSIYPICTHLHSAITMKSSSFRYLHIPLPGWSSASSIPRMGTSFCSKNLVDMPPDQDAKKPHNNKKIYILLCPPDQAAKKTHNKKKRKLYHNYIFIS